MRTGRSAGWRAVAWLVAGWAVLTGLLCLTGVVIKHSSPIRSLDRHITHTVVEHRSAALDDAMKAATRLGTWYAVLGVVLVVAVLIGLRKLPRVALLAVVVAWTGESWAVNIAKTVVERPRPPEAIRLVVAHGWSFPSGHTANGVVVFGTLAGLVVVLTTRRGLRVAAYVVAAAGAALVAFSRIELGVHWFTDTLASLAWTMAWLVLVLSLLRRIGPGIPRDLPSRGISAGNHDPA